MSLYFRSLYLIEVRHSEYTKLNKILPFDKELGYLAVILATLQHYPVAFTVIF